MTKLYQVIIGDGTRSAAIHRVKLLLTAGAVALGLIPSWAAQSLQTPRGREVFGNVGMAAPRPAAAGAGGPRTLLLAWDYPVSLQTPDLIFKVYHTTNLLLPLKSWPLLTNVPGSWRTVAVVANRPLELFILTASNFLGESDYARP